MLYHNTSIIIFLILILLLLLGFQFYYYNYKNTQVVNSPTPSIIEKRVLVPTPISEPRDIIRDYDYSKTYDPLSDPTRRVSRYDIPPGQIQRYLDIPTRGYPDTFQQLGILVKKGNPSKNPENKIIRLFGRQEFPGSNRWEYYTMISTGNDQIKMPLDVKRGTELYDDDTINISQLNDDYRVELFKFDQPRYYPHLF